MPGLSQALCRAHPDGGDELALTQPEPPLRVGGNVRARPPEPLRAEVEG